jgi:exodeoxyribonuclease-3
MRVLTLNCNGIRSASRKGLYEWLAKQSADVICLQETRAAEVDLSGKEFSLKGYRAEHVHASRRGYSGVSAYWRERAARVVRGFGSREFDDEGRYLELQFPELSVVSVYFPSGSSGPERQAAKFRFLEQFRAHLAALRRRRRHYIVCGDLNIAHRNVDIKNWRGNQKNSGFLPEERAWLDDVFGGGGYADAFRLVNQDAGQYTWWSNRGQAWTKNVGWRIDYQVVSAGLADRVRGASIWKQSRFSDHAPLIIDYADGL